MADRYIRKYEIVINTPQDEEIIIKPPFSMHATIERNTFASANKCNLTIINLGTDNRNKIYKDYNTSTDYWQLTIKAGYEGSSLFTLFQGNIYQAYPFRQGTEWITQIEGFDGQHDMQNAYTSKTIQKNTEQKDIIKQVINDLPNIITGVLSNTLFTGENKRGKVFFAPTREVLYSETYGKYYIDNEKIYALDRNEVVSSDVIKLDKALLKTTPRRRENLLDCECLFFPEAQLDYILELSSKYEKFNGQYAIKGFKHDINISGAECGDANTTIQLDSGTQSFEVAS